MRTVHAGPESRRTAWNQRCMPTSSMASTRVTTTGCKSCTRPAPVLHHVLHNVLLSTPRVGTICTCTAMLSRSVPPNLPHGHRGCYIADARLPSLAVCHAAAASHGHRCCVSRAPNVHACRKWVAAHTSWGRHANPSVDVRVSSIPVHIAGLQGLLPELLQVSRWMHLQNCGTGHCC